MGLVVSRQRRGEGRAVLRGFSKLIQHIYKATDLTSTAEINWCSINGLDLTVEINGLDCTHLNFLNFQTSENQNK